MSKILHGSEYVLRSRMKLSFIIDDVYKYKLGLSNLSNLQKKLLTNWKMTINSQKGCKRVAFSSKMSQETNKSFIRHHSIVRHKTLVKWN